jgi:hypothetical protein
MGITNNNPFVINTTTTYTYSAVGQFNCVVTDQVVVTVNQPQVNAGANQTVCAGTAVTLSGTGSTALLWNNNVINGSPFTPDSTQTYTVSGTDANGCYGTDQVVVSVNTPLISAGSDVTICSGDTVTLIATGLQTPAWNNNVVNGVGFVPTTSASFEVSGTDVNGCAGTDQVLVTVNQTANTVLNEVTLGSYTLNGQTYLQSGSYTQTLMSQNGCDSIITLNLSISGVGISEDNLAFTVSPNPSTDFIQVIGNDMEQKVVIKDAIGRIVFETAITKMDSKISIEKLLSGNYFMEFSASKARISFIKR